jgi:glyoxylase-like metal-dependent hydrolase (beta-lactamase superfamily II)
MGSSPAHLLAPGVWRVPVAPADGINAFVLRGEDGQVALIDAGMPWAWGRLEAGLRHLGLGVEDVTRVLVTHAHADHVGNVARVREVSQAPVWAHGDDAEHLRAGASPPIDRSLRWAGLKARWGRYPAVAVDQTLADGALVDIAGGLRVVHTPGHTPGHTSYLHEPTGVLITGDVIHYWRAQVRIGMRMYCHDIALNERSAHLLGDLEYDTVAFTHGPHIARGGRDRVRAFLASRGRP